MKKKTAVSACLVGANCKYSGENNLSAKVLKYLEDKEYITVCPECSGGLPVPRMPCEIRVTDGVRRVYSSDGIEYTDEYYKGAEKELEAIRSFGAKECILKENSPSCGVHRIYDGTFSSVKIQGSGIAAEIFRKEGICVLSDEDIPD
ncbi:MAG: DUF523 domain-containing protein [Eubacteriales bacterium]|nr:DUF523 domain-containing protein [Eubacteriales bacterium]